MPPRGRIDDQLLAEHLLAAGAQTFWSLSTTSGTRGGAVPLSLNVPLSVAQPVGSAAAAGCRGGGRCLAAERRPQGATRC